MTKRAITRPRLKPASKPATQLAAFPETAWSSFWRADDGPDARRRRLETLARRYWNPVYTVLLQRGLQDADAKDAAQDFFAAFHRDTLAEKYDPTRGKFRTFLRMALLDFVKKHRRTHKLRQRGEDRRTADTPEAYDPGRTFDRAWVRDLLDRSLDEARATLAARGFPRAVDLHLRFAAAGDKRATFEPVANEFGLTVAEVRNQLHMVRSLVREIMIDGIRDTVTSPEDLADEVRFVFGPRA